ncbi:hypothetical protein CBR_g54997 [Chara braunii]|uniref:RNA-directed DNA polymerase n=1 Tax=Chara braunii TaxID=69332 RepID=A0A388K7L0_CHABU|nr:hypothetical protein CBR_g54997 [Chara braunii]|eukprot:GBG66017.1 hypothetical protein CBR_g54997 [Chara braunii]
MAPAELDELRRQLKELTEKGWIRPSTSPFGSPVLFVPKKGGSLRMCIDYRGLNAITVKNAEPLPRIDDLLDRVQGLLAQEDGKKLRPIEYMSKKMPSKKPAKSTYERELYALYKALVHWRHFLLGRFFHLRTDHQTLKWSKTQPALSDALKRWIEVIDEYNFKLEYLKGEYNKVADALSRRADYLGALVYEFGVSEEVTQSLVGAYLEDPVTMDIIRKLRAKDKATEDEFVMVDGLLFLRKAGIERLVVPSSENLRSLFLGEYHDATGHFGYKETRVNLVQRFWWPGMLDDAKKYVETCHVCHRDKPRTQAPLGLLKPLPIPAGPGQSVSMDFMDTLVTSRSGKRHIFIIIDRFTKYARLIAMPETARTEHVIKLFSDNWVRDFGLPKSIISDRDVRFTSELWKKTVEQMGSQLQMTSGNHPEADGQAEQMNRVVQHLLRHYIKPNQDDWDEKLPLIASLYNNVVQSNIGVGPNQLHLGWKPRPALDFLMPENRPSATPGTLEYGVQYEKLLQQVVEHIRKSQEAMIAFENKHRRQSTFQATCSALIDCRASRNFMSQAFMARAGLGPRVRRKTQPTQVTLADGRTQKSINRCVDDVPVYFAALACEPVSFDILDTKFDMILGMSWLSSADHPVNFHDRTVHIRDRNGVLVPCTVATPHTSIACHVVSVARIRDAIARNDVEEMGLVFLHALPSPDGPAASPPDPHISHLLDEYRDVFEAPTGTVPDRPIRHGITLEAGAIPPRGCIYRMSEEELEVLRAQLDDLLDKGWIRPSCSPYGAPVLFVRKKNKDLRLCIDYRKLNAQTVKNADPLPRIDDLLERLGGATYFSKLDLKSGYLQIEIQPQDRYKTAFKTRYGHFEWVVTPFGLTNAPATFQAAMTTEFRDLLDRSVLIYLDDILVYSRTLDEHIIHLRVVLNRLRLAKYKANLDKCEFAKQELEYSGHFVTPKGIRPLADKIQAIVDWPEPLGHRLHLDSVISDIGDLWSSTF